MSESILPHFFIHFAGHSSFNHKIILQTNSAQENQWGSFLTVFSMSMRKNIPKLRCLLTTIFFLKNVFFNDLVDNVNHNLGKYFTPQREETTLIPNGPNSFSILSYSYYLLLVPFSVYYQTLRVMFSFHLVYKKLTIQVN